MDIVQNIRDLARPWLTFLFSSSFVGIIIIIACTVESLTFDQGMALAGLLSNPLSAILGYHFAKKATKDTP